MLDYTVDRWEVWPRKVTPGGDHKRSPFKGIWSRVLHDLGREIRMLGGERVVFRLNVDPRHIRLDGQLRADARPYTYRTHPDRNNGDRLAYDNVEQARAVLSTYHGVSL